MEITNIEARWLRRKPREQYGHSEAELRATAILDTGEDPDAAMDSLLGKLATAVSVKLGIAAKPAAEAATPTADKPADTAEKPAKKAAKKAAKPADKPADKPSSSDGDNIRNNPEDRTDPAEATSTAAADDIPDGTETAAKKPAKKAAKKAADDIPDETETAGAAEAEQAEEPSAEGDGMSLKELQDYINKVAASGKVKVASIREVLAEYKATQIAAVPEDKREEFRDRVKALVEGEGEAE